ncbi:MAG: ribosomal protein S18-alanine N-acetyltransferase [Nitrospirae bacterium]|nr:ribosomal protein S18-alanine N-acetyltransferase [Nitrospirota bacterium]
MVLIREDNIVIEDMKEEDLFDVMQIEREAFSDPWAIEMFHSELFNSFSRLWVARQISGKLVGYFCFWRVVDEAHIMNIAVLKNYRRKGIARIILLFAIDYWKIDGVKTVLLEVRRSNMAAQELYRKFGFNVIVCRTKYYKNPVEDALVMALEL